MIEYCLYQIDNGERFDLGAGRWDILFDISTSTDRKPFKFSTLITSILVLAGKIKNDYRLRPGFDDILHEGYVDQVANDIWEWAGPNKEPPSDLELWEKEDFFDHFSGTMEIREFLEAYPFTGTRFYV